MICIITGGCSIDDMCVLEKALKICPFTSRITEVVNSACDGIEMLGLKWAEENNRPFVAFPICRRRNSREESLKHKRKIVEYADALIAIYNGKSKGTANMIKIAE